MDDKMTPDVEEIEVNAEEVIAPKKKVSKKKQTKDNALKVEKKPYKMKVHKSIGGKDYFPGDTIELTEKGARIFNNKKYI